jgi:trehalose synthase
MAFEVRISPMDPERFRSVLSPERFAAFQRAIEEGRELLAGRAVWNVNSTARGGGVVELLRPLIAYARGAGVDARWMVLEGGSAFFGVTKRIHNDLHGSPGDGGALDEAARRVYEDVLAANVEDFARRIRPGDVVILHDPQTAGLVTAMRAAGAAAVIWRCHVGIDTPNDLARGAWAFLVPYLRDADAYVFSRESFVWDGLDRERIVVIAPTIDVFSPKNLDLTDDTVRAVLEACGVIADGVMPVPPSFVRPDGTPGRVERRVRMVEDEPLHGDDPVVLQVSRWDALKDPVGVIRGFEYVPEETGGHLVYAAPAVEAVADDPEGAQVVREAFAARDQAPASARRRIHLASLPLDDLDENAIIVNALQRHARVVVQKSLAEGFGLTVAEAMWKSRPVVASRVGGIQEQIVDGDTGILLDDPGDLAAYGGAVSGLLLDEAGAEEMGARARERVRDRFTSPRTLLDYLDLIRRLMVPAS